MDTGQARTGRAGQQDAEACVGNLIADGTRVAPGCWAGGATVSVGRVW
jgi:hypothetical protein